MSNILFIEACNFEDFPPGGQLSFAKQVIQALGSRASLVGLSTDATPVGKWIKKEIGRITYDFYATHRRVPSAKKPFIPGRMTAYLKMRKHRENILSRGIKNAFIISPEALMAVYLWGWNSICYTFAGVENPLLMPRYAWGKIFAGFFERKLFKALQSVDVILAAADRKAIEELSLRSKGFLSKDRVIQFPGAVDIELFHPIDKKEARMNLGIEPDLPMVVSCGRINRVKGWDLVLDAYANFLSAHPKAQMFFVGDGEDRIALEERIRKLKLQQSVRITGFQTEENVVNYLNAADLIVFGSHKEGWATAMLEGLACGKPIVSTDVSGARDMIVQGKNGFIVGQRDPLLFANAMRRSLSLENASRISLEIAKGHSLKDLASKLRSVWKVLPQ